MTSGGVVVIGNFDGVHLGHQKVLQQARNLTSGPLTVVTFWPHTLSVVAPRRAPRLLMDLNTRIDALKDAGATQVRVVRFTPEVAAWPARDFVSRVINPLAPDHVVVGHNFRFGVGASGDVARLRQLGRGRFEVMALDLLQVDEIVTCSTLIREALAAGDVEKVARHLGREYRFRSVVVLGDQRGRQLGFPTANQIVPPELALPADGVYAGYLSRLDVADGKRMPAAISVGTNPTFEGHDRRVETYVLGRDDLDLYGAEVAVDFVGRLRAQIKYSRVENLVEQLQADVAQVARMLQLQ